MAFFGSRKEEDFLSNKKDGKIYVADFNGGKYISISDYPDIVQEDMIILFSTKIEIRITYLINSEKIEGLKITKLKSGKIEETMTLSKMSFEWILKILEIFSSIDLSAVSKGSLLINSSVIEDPEKLKTFLFTIANDPTGKEKLEEVIHSFGILQKGDLNSLVFKKQSIETFEKLLNDSGFFDQYKQEKQIKKNEEVWQQFFSENNWILGTEFIEILDERVLDTSNTTDFLAKSYDGFLDIIELKLPNIDFWINENLPKSEPTKATIQCMRYITQVERKINDLIFSQSVNNTPIMKPRITLIYGRSKDWNTEQKEVYRNLVSSYHNITILTYDHVLDRAKRMIQNLS